jgi:dsDNA-specific endonuclease/ATPase MutS2
MANTTQVSEVENLSRIRDILFGDELQSIEQKLGAAKDNNINVVEKLKYEIENRLKDIELLQQEKLNEAGRVQESNFKIQSELLDELKQEIADLNGTINSNKEQFDVKLANLENTANQTINQLKEDYELIINNLKSSKVDKNSLADMLNDLAENLKK